MNNSSSYLVPQEQSSLDSLNTEQTLLFLFPHTDGCSLYPVHEDILLPNLLLLVSYVVPVVFLRSSRGVYIYLIWTTKPS